MTKFHPNRFKGGRTLLFISKDKIKRPIIKGTTQSPSRRIWSSSVLIKTTNLVVCTRLWLLISIKISILCTLIKAHQTLWCSHRMECLRSSGNLYLTTFCKEERTRCKLWGLLRSVEVFRGRLSLKLGRLGKRLSQSIREGGLFQIIKARYRQTSIISGNLHKILPIRCTGRIHRFSHPPKSISNQGQTFQGQ